MPVQPALQTLRADAVIVVVFWAGVVLSARGGTGGIAKPMDSSLPPLRASRRWW